MNEYRLLHEKKEAGSERVVAVFERTKLSPDGKGAVAVNAATRKQGSMSIRKASRW